MNGRRIITTGMWLLGWVLILGANLSLIFVLLPNALPIAIMGPTDAALMATAGVVLSLIAGLTLIAAAERLDRRTPDPGLCLHCGYDLRGNPETTRCPECGERP